MRVPAEYERQRLGGLGYRVLGLDIDGVCADYTEGFRRFCAEQLDLPATSFPDPANYNLAKAGWPFSSTADYLAMHRAAVESGLYARLPPYAGVSDALWEISRADVHIRIVSHRLFLSGLHRQVIRDTADWLESNDIPYMSLCITGLKDSVDANLYVEDSPSMIQALRNSDRAVVVFDQQYNRDLDGPRIVDWKSGVSEILRTLDK